VPDGILSATERRRMWDRPSRPFPTIVQATILLILICIGKVIIDLGLSAVTSAHSEARSAALVIGESIFVAAATYGILRRTGARAQAVFPSTVVRGSQAGAMVLMLLGAMALVLSANYLQRTVWPKPDRLVRLTQEHRQGNAWEAVIGPAVAAPLIEETLFRGVLLYAFLGRYSRRTALVASASLFALYHMNPWQMPGAFIIGIVLGSWVILARSLAPCIIGHAVLNLVPWMMARFTGRVYRPPSLAVQPLTLLSFSLAGMLVLGTGTWLLWRASSEGAVIATEE